MKKKIAIVIDSTADLRETENSDFYKLKIPILGEKNGKMVEITDSKEEEIVKAINDCTAITSQTPQNDIKNLLNDLVNKYERIIILPVSARFSGLLNQIKLIIKQEKLKNVFAYDTLSAGKAILLIAKDIYNFALTNDWEEVDDYIKRYFNSLKSFIYISDLKHIKKSGRLGTLTKCITSLIEIAPIIEVTPSKININLLTRNPENAAKKFIKKNFNHSFNNISVVLMYSPYANKKTKIFVNHLQSLLQSELNKSSKIINCCIPNAVSVHTGFSGVGIQIFNNI